MPAPRQAKRPTRQPKVPRPQFPTKAERIYRDFLARYVREMHALTVRLLKPALERAAGAIQPRTDDDEGAVSDVFDALKKIKVEWSRAATVAEIEAMLRLVGKDVSLVSRLNLTEIIRKVAGVDPLLRDKPLAARMELFRRSNVDLIRTIDQRYFAEIDAIVRQGMAAGTRPADMMASVADRYGVSEARANLIARDQTAKLNGQLDQARQTDLGVTRYVWQSSVDERVRPTHAERDGEIFFWDDPPGDMDDPADGGHPGMPIACRCVSFPILSDVLDALEAE